MNSFSDGVLNRRVAGSFFPGHLQFAFIVVPVKREPEIANGKRPNKMKKIVDRCGR